METLSVKNAVSFHQQTNTSKGILSNLIHKLEFYYFSVIAMTISLGSIMGGLAAMKIFEANAPIWQLSVVMATTMASNVASIGQASTKWVVNLFLLAFTIAVLFFVINL